MPADLEPGAAEHRITLLETLDRVLNKGVVIAGDVTISVADVDLIFVGLRLLLSSVETASDLRLTREASSTACRKYGDTHFYPLSLDGRG